VDVGQKDVTGRPGDAHLVLPVQGQLKIVAPVAPVQAIVGQDRIIKENAQTLKILVDAVSTMMLGAITRNCAPNPTPAHTVCGKSSTLALGSAP